MNASVLCQNISILLMYTLSTNCCVSPFFGHLLLSHFPWQLSNVLSFSLDNIHQKLWSQTFKQLCFCLWGETSQHKFLTCPDVIWSSSTQLGNFFFLFFKYRSESCWCRVSARLSVDLFIVSLGLVCLYFIVKMGPADLPLTKIPQFRDVSEWILVSYEQTAKCDELCCRD